MIIRTLLRICTAALAVIGASGHGYLSEPVSRNLAHGNNYCPQCLNMGGSWSTFGGGADRQTACGDPWTSPRPRPHERGGQFGDAPAHKLQPGGTLWATVQFTANHLGRWGLQICDSGAEDLGCFRTLEREDGRGAWVQVPPESMSFRAEFSLPADLRACERCTLRWVYWTGNSCTPAGTPPGPWRNDALDTCFANPWTIPEMFANCANVRIESSKAGPEGKPCAHPGWKRPKRGKKCVPQPKNRG